MDYYEQLEVIDQQYVWLLKICMDFLNIVFYTTDTGWVANNTMHF